MRGLFRHLAFAALFCLLGVGVVAYLRGPAGVPAALNRREQLLKMEQDNRALREEVERRKQEIQRLNTDQSYRDQKVREKLNLQKRNEQTIYLPDTPKSKD